MVQTLTVLWESGASQRQTAPEGLFKYFPLHFPKHFLCFIKNIFPGWTPGSASRSASTTPTVLLGSIVRRMCVDQVVDQTAIVLLVRFVDEGLRIASESVKMDVISAMIVPLAG